MTNIKGSSNIEVESTVAIGSEPQQGKRLKSSSKNLKKTETMVLVLNQTAVTTTTPSLTRPIPSPGPFSRPSDCLTHRCSEGSIFTYSNAYPIPHCIHSNGQPQLQAQSMDLLNLADSGLNSVILDDDALTSLILEMELDKINVLPELQVVNFDLTECNVLNTTNREL